MDGNFSKTPKMDEAVRLAKGGMTIGQISDETGQTYDGVRCCLNRAGVKAKHARETDHRDIVADMRPLDAVEYLLNVIDVLSEVAANESAIDAYGVQLSNYECRIFDALHQHQGRILSRESIGMAIYYDRPDGDMPGLKVIDVLIWKMKRKIASTPFQIENVWGRGWRLVEKNLGGEAKDPA